MEQQTKQETRSDMSVAPLPHRDAPAGPPPHMPAGFFSDSLAASDPEIYQSIRQELGRQQDQIELIASGEYRLPRRHRGAGFGTDEQIRRGPAGPPLLWRLRICRYRRATGDRPRQAAVWLRIRQCAAPFRRPGEHGGDAGADQTRRDHHGPVALGRRPPDPRRRAQRLGQMVQRRAIWRPPPGRPDRL